MPWDRWEMGARAGLVARRRLAGAGWSGCASGALRFWGVTADFAAGLVAAGLGLGLVFCPATFLVTAFLVGSCLRGLWEAQAIQHQRSPTSSLRLTVRLGFVIAISIGVWSIAMNRLSVTQGEHVAGVARCCSVRSHGAMSDGQSTQYDVHQCNQVMYTCVAVMYTKTQNHLDVASRARTAAIRSMACSGVRHRSRSSPPPVSSGGTSCTSRR